MASERAERASTAPGGGDAEAFLRASEEKPAGFVREFAGYLRAHKKWWLLPIIVALVLLGIFALLTATGAGPALYTLF